MILSSAGDESVPHSMIRTVLLPRLAALFAILCCLKLVGFIRGRELFYQEYWRVSTSISLSLFSVWVLLIAVFLFWLGFATRSAATSTTRRLHLTLAVGGLLLFVLTPFSFLEKSYLETFLDAILDARDFYAYWVVDFFDSPRYLGAYVAAYLIGWWFCARIKREFWMLWLMAVLWVPYAYLNLRFLSDGSFELGVLLVVGVALIPAAWNHWRLSGWIYVVPVCLSLGLWLLLAPLGEKIRDPSPAFVILTVLALAGTTIALFLNRASRPFCILAPFFITSFLVATHQHYSACAGYRSLVIQAQGIPLYLIGEAVPVVGIGLVAIAAASWRPLRRSVWWWVDLLGIFLIVWTYVDFRVTGILGVRLTWEVLTMTDNPGLVLKSIHDYLTLSLWVTVITLVVAYFAGAWLMRLWLKRSSVVVPPAAQSVGSTIFGFQRLWHWLRHRAECHPTLTTGLLALVLLMFVFHSFGRTDKMNGSAPVRLVCSLPVVKNWNKSSLSDKEFRAAWKTLGFPPPTPRAATAGTAPQPPLNVVLVVLESSYPRYLSLFGAPDQTQPLLSAYRNRMELFSNFYSVFPNSNHARFSVLSGLYPIKPYVSYVNPRIPVPCLYEILRQYGYRNYFYYSSFRDYTRQDDYLKGRALDCYEDANTMPDRNKFRKVSWGISEEATLNGMLAGLDEAKRAGQPFSLTYIPAIPHMPYDLPDSRFKKFEMGISPTLGGNYEGAYKNELLYIDWILASLIDGLRSRGQLDNTLIVITNDHGEGLGVAGVGGGSVGHGWNLDPELTNTPLILMDPRHPGYRLNPTLGCHTDVLPTILERLGLSPPVGVPYQGVSLHSAAAMKRQAIYLNSCDDRAIVTPDEYWMETGEPGARQVKCFRIAPRTLPTRFLPQERENSTAQKELTEKLNLFEKLQEQLILNYRRSQTGLMQPEKQ